uniref:Basigin (Ok blood group) n=1 Tax=Rousettus aegyptiacus TaxID=9407 RepID=A0A7J8BP36_ROUAE|nr:basigin (Ok blood group) [Rousettus aegyptiacus]
MAAALLAVLGLALLGAESGSGAGSAISTSISTDGSKTHLTCTLNGSDTEIVGHRWVKGDKVLKEDALPGLKTQYELDTEEGGGQYLCVFLPEVVGKASVNVKGPPKVKAVKKSEHVTEGEGAVLACKSESFPPACPSPSSVLSKETRPARADHAVDPGRVSSPLKTAKLGFSLCRVPFLRGVVLSF